jgi:hypothetical protein
MTCPDGITADSLIYCKSSPPALQFELQGNMDAATFRVQGQPYFLSYRGTTGAMKLVSDQTDAYWQLQKIGDKYAIRNLGYNDYVWATDSGEAYLTRSGDPTNDDALWYVDGL